ncbi:MAG: DUF4443 domain-containing protein [Nitrososphaerales archaeon]
MPTNLCHPRTLIKRLRDAGLISIETNGCELARKGKSEFNSVMNVLPWKSIVEGSNFGTSKSCFAIIAHDCRKRVRLGIERRDAAIKAGATGALTGIYSSDRYLIPVEGLTVKRQRALKNLRERSELRNQRKMMHHHKRR